MLSKTNSRRLTTLTFSITCSDLKTKLNLEGLSVVLSHKRYSALEQVVFDVETGREHIDNIQEQLKTRLSFLAEKGVNIFTQSTSKAS